MLNCTEHEDKRLKMDFFKQMWLWGLFKGKVIKVSGVTFRHLYLDRQW